jgi:hypothetical protein
MLDIVNGTQVLKKKTFVPFAVTFVFGEES